MMLIALPTSRHSTWRKLFIEIWLLEMSWWEKHCDVSMYKMMMMMSTALCCRAILIYVAIVLTTVLQWLDMNHQTAHCQLRCEDKVSQSEFSLWWIDLLRYIVARRYSFCVQSWFSLLSNASCVFVPQWLWNEPLCRNWIQCCDYEERCWPIEGRLSPSCVG